MPAGAPSWDLNRSKEGIARFNALFDQMIADRAANPDFGRKWIEARKGAKEVAGTTTKNR